MKSIINIFLFISLLNLSCGKEDLDLILDVPVNYNASINNQLPRLNSPGGVEIVANTNIGVAGLILYKRGDGRIVAFDRCSSVNPQQKNPVQLIGTTGPLVEDKVSGAYFSLEDGSPAKAPATRPLKRYSVSINGDIISVIN